MSYGTIKSLSLNPEPYFKKLKYDFSLYLVDIKFNLLFYLKTKFYD